LHSYPAWPFLSDTSHPLASAIWAVFIHGVIGVIVVAPIVWHSRQRILYGLIAFVGGSVLDLDHVVAAGSISPHALETDCQFLCNWSFSWCCSCAGFCCVPSGERSALRSGIRRITM
jgi:hypothetical protein